MIWPGSVIHAPEAEWAERLRERALAGPAPHDFDALISSFRDRGEFWRSRIGGQSEWADIPPLEKHEVADVPVADDATIRSTRTSGTTGAQVTICNSRREREFRRALLYRPQLFYELPAEVTQLVFVDGDWCADRNTPAKVFAYGGRQYRTWFAGVAADPRAVLRLLRDIRPPLVRGIASGIVRFIESTTAALDGLGVRYVGPGGEFLAPEWRATIAGAFAATVLDRYGSTESGAIAWQCPECGQYHANADEIVIEPDAAGLLTTPLFISSQPLLRYRLGDRVRFEAAAPACRIGLPTLTIEAARRDDWLVDGHGRRVSPLAFQFEQIAALTAWRLHQSADGSLQLYFDATPGAAVEAALQREIRRAVPGCGVRLVRGVWKLRRGGKFKRVSSDFPGAATGMDGRSAAVGETAGFGE